MFGGFDVRCVDRETGQLIGYAVCLLWHWKAVDADGNDLTGGSLLKTMDNCRPIIEAAAIDKATKGE